MEFRLLGGVEVSASGQPVDIGHARQRCVLAVLLIEANNPVSTDVLLDRVWDEGLPHSARGTLQSYLTRLRRALGSDAEIVRRSGGYALVVDEQSIDMHRFRELLAQARSAGDDETALDLFDQAMELWRGEPFAGLDTPWINSMRDSYEHERRTAELDRTDVLLRVGRHSELVGPLLSEARKQPFDERLAGQVMLALFQSGRQADALNHFRQTRQYLAEELGTDPGPALQALHQRILAGDPTLVPSEPPVPDRAARELAEMVHRQWTKEAGSLRRPNPLSVRWSITGRPVAAEEPVSAARGDFTQLVRTFRTSPSRQMVVLGEPGAGKTVLALLLTLALLERTRAGDPVPVLLTASSWDPRTEHVHSWLARRLTEEYPALGGEAARLVSDGRITLILDGLDEMPEALHADAINALDHVSGDLVLTCRTTEYEAAVARGGVLLTKATVVEIEPVQPADATAFLLSAGPPARKRWQPVLDQLRPELPLAQALTSPLMVTLARTVYTATTTDPAELLDEARFPTRAAIEDHLLEAFIPTAYTSQPAPPEAALRQYPPEQAQTWLRFLARQLNRSDSHDIAWWELLRAVSRPARTLLVGLASAVAFGLAGAVAGGLGSDRPEWTLYGGSYAVAFGLAGALVFWVAPRTSPVRVELRFRGSWPRFFARFAAGAVIGVALGLGMGLPKPIVAGVGVAIGLAVGIRVWLGTPAEVDEVSSPRVVLRQDRIAALVLGLAFALALTFPGGMAVGVPTLETAGHTVGTIDIVISALGGAVAGAAIGAVWFGWIGVLAYGFASGVAGGLIFGPVYPNVSGVGVGIAFGTIFGLSVACISVLSGLGARSCSAGCGWRCVDICRGG
ncbi:BTAD domain-containing putative transcriptional regulator [Kibdelosporangium philippinense]|uniref:BTAD domain-containing putative transcriptional regulator n=1 Tax=Kibdelosporangium philippinense TaxID=211113 RepID=UPI003618F3AB